MISRGTHTTSFFVLVIIAGAEGCLEMTDRKKNAVKDTTTVTFTMLIGVKMSLKWVFDLSTDVTIGHTFTFLIGTLFFRIPLFLNLPILSTPLTE